MESLFPFFMALAVFLGAAFNVQAENTKELNANTKCGSEICKTNETCVTWIKAEEVPSTNSSQSIGEVSFKECFLDDGHHHAKMNPTTRICGEDELFSIVNEPQPCLRDTPPCSLTWKYKCNKSANITHTHSCEQKSCPSSWQCTELIACDLDPPCVTKAICVTGGRTLEPKK